MKEFSEGDCGDVEEVRFPSLPKQTLMRVVLVEGSCLYLTLVSLIHHESLAD